MQLVPISVHAFRIISFSYFFSGMAIFSSAFFTALNDGKVSALISFLRTFVFELGAVLLLPVLFGVEGIWCSVVIGDLMAAVAGSIFMSVLRRMYHYWNVWKSWYKCCTAQYWTWMKQIPILNIWVEAFKVSALFLWWRWLANVISNWDTTPEVKCVSCPSSSYIRFSKLGQIMLPFNWYVMTFVKI